MVNRESIVIGLFSGILTLTVFVTLVALDVIHNLPLDMNLAWGTVVLLGLVSTYYFLSGGAEA